ncbi:MAG: hypothetical protein WC716_15690 [Chitinophagaceae bacterium]
MDFINIEIVKSFLSNNALEFNSAQSRLSYPIIERIFYILKAGIIFDLIKVDREKNLIVHGHHRYVSLALHNSATIENIPWTASFSSIAHPWSTVEISEEDFDQPEDVARYVAEYGEINTRPN